MHKKTLKELIAKITNERKEILDRYLNMAMDQFQVNFENINRIKIRECNQLSMDLMETMILVDGQKVYTIQTIIDNKEFKITLNVINHLEGVMPK